MVQSCNCEDCQQFKVNACWTNKGIKNMKKVKNMKNKKKEEL